MQTKQAKKDYHRVYMRTYYKGVRPNRPGPNLPPPRDESGELICQGRMYSQYRKDGEAKRAAARKPLMDRLKKEMAERHKALRKQGIKRGPVHLPKKSFLNGWIAG